MKLLHKGLILISVPLAFEPVSARLLSARSVACIRPLADKKNILIENAVGNKLVLADSERLTQVLVNLLSNAIKFSNENQAIRIDSTRDSESGNLVVSVRDTFSGYRSFTDSREQIPI